ncbi:MAG TPA: hypothetical protein VFG23_08595 [Polyangia bacterium]|nr:hypothetical protein [Polyangia bacterium]
MTRSLSSLILVVSLAQLGCHRRPLPEGFPRKYLDDLDDIAAETAKRCDEILASPNCYVNRGEPQTPSDVVVPLPTNPLGGAPELRYLGATCATAQPTRICDSQFSPTADRAPPCDVWTDDPNWGPLNPGQEGTAISVSPQGSCHQRWVGVSIVRHSRKGAELNLRAAFLLNGPTNVH